MEEAIKAVLIGAGNRGMTIYGNFALNYPEKLNFIAVAEPIKHRREKFAQLHKIPEDFQFEEWHELLNHKKLGDLVCIATQDQMHIEPALKAIEVGYDVLLEKPMAHTLNGCVEIVKKAEEKDKILGIAHVLRYTNFFSKIKENIDKGILGNVINITHRENVSWFHMAHSFVRGNWGNEQDSSPMILAKCCHDLDILYWLVGEKPKTLQSIGSLRHFKEENAPEGAPQYCLDGCPAKDNCLYYAPRIYVDIEPIIQVVKKSDNGLFKFFANLRKNHLGILKIFTTLIPPLRELRYWKAWPIEPLYHNVEHEDYSDKAKLEILKDSPYGRCVYHCDNDVVDHQLVNIEFENGVTANLCMHGFSEKEGRTIRIDGTKATLFGDFSMSGEKIWICDHLTGEEKLIYEQKLSLRMASHGGGDENFIDSFLQTLRSRKAEPLTSARASLESHLMAFAAENSRLNESVINMIEFKKSLELI